MLTLTHRRKMVPVLAAAVLAAVITAGAAPATAQAKTGRPNRTNGSGQPWRNPGQPPGVRAGELLAALNTDQKIQLALGDFAALASFGVGTSSADLGHLPRGLTILDGGGYGHSWSQPPRWSPGHPVWHPADDMNVASMSPERHGCGSHVVTGRPQVVTAPPISSVNCASRPDVCQ